MHIKEYIIENKIVKKTIKAFKNPKFSSGPDKKGKSLEMIKNLKNELLNDPTILILCEAEDDINKYNL